MGKNCQDDVPDLIRRISWSQKSFTSFNDSVTSFESFSEHSEVMGMFDLLVLRAAEQKTEDIINLHGKEGCTKLLLASGKEENYDFNSDIESDEDDFESTIQNLREQWGVSTPSTPTKKKLDHNMVGRTLRWNQSNDNSSKERKKSKGKSKAKKKLLRNKSMETPSKKKKSKPPRSNSLYVKPQSFSQPSTEVKPRKQDALPPKKSTKKVGKDKRDIPSKVPVIFDDSEQDTPERKVHRHRSNPNPQTKSNSKVPRTNSLPLSHKLRQKISSDLHKEASDLKKAALDLKNMIEARRKSDRDLLNSMEAEPKSLEQSRRKSDMDLLNSMEAKPKSSKQSRRKSDIARLGIEPKPKSFKKSRGKSDSSIETKPQSFSYGQRTWSLEESTLLSHSEHLPKGKGKEKPSKHLTKLPFAKPSKLLRSRSEGQKNKKVKKNVIQEIQDREHEKNIHKLLAESGGDKWERPQRKKELSYPKSKSDTNMFAVKTTGNEGAGFSFWSL